MCYAGALDSSITYMSRIGRYVFDELRKFGLPAARLPYADAAWWDRNYDELGARALEWGGVGFTDLHTHTWCPHNTMYLAAFAQGTLFEAKLTDHDLAGGSYGPVGKLLVLGGGTSRLSEEMHSAGWQNVLDIDFSPTVVRQNQARAIAHGLNFAEVDARTMRPESLSSLMPCRADSMPPVKSDQGLFDTCVDKGLVDGLWCGGLESSKSIPTVVKSVASVLKPGGRLLTLSWTSPRHMFPLLSEHSTLWSVIEARKLKSLYLYVLERSERSFGDATGMPASGERPISAQGSQPQSPRKTKGNSKHKDHHGRWL